MLGVVSCCVLRLIETRVVVFVTLCRLHKAIDELGSAEVHEDLRELLQEHTAGIKSSQLAEDAFGYQKKTEGVEGGEKSASPRRPTGS